MTTVSKPLVSIIIPTYNRAHILSSAIESAIKQTYLNKQIIVVDDGSVDETRELVAQYPQVEYIFQTNGGQGKARNTGLHRATGIYIASLDSDDSWNVDFIERCVEKLENENLGFVFANWTQIADNKKSYDFFAKTKMLNTYINSSNNTWILLENEKLRKIYLKLCPSPSSSFVFRREPMLYWNEQLKIGDDWCLLLDMILLNGYNAAFTNEKLWTKRTGGQNVYEGRNIIEILEYLHVSDCSAILERHKHNLKESEIALLDINISIGIYKLYLHKLFKLKLTSNDHIKFTKVLCSNPFLFGKASLLIIFRFTKKILKKIIDKGYSTISDAN
ncbi:MAG: hypothetical protein JWP44_2759 [Mucilaginibacter sp.]|nr:hypothetical protein [Mucilaginibacter sp.]